MMQGGAHGFFKPEQGDENLIKCVHVVARGDYWLEAELINRILKGYQDKNNVLRSLVGLSTKKLKKLTPREMEILALVSESMTNEEIAEKLFLSTKTVKTHVRNIFEKTNIRSRVEAALMYTRHELLSRAT